MAPCICVWRLISSAEPKGSQAAAGPRRQLIHSASPSFNLSTRKLFVGWGQGGQLPTQAVAWISEAKDADAQTLLQCSQRFWVHLAQGRTVMSLND